MYPSAIRPLNHLQLEKLLHIMGDCTPPISSANATAHGALHDDSSTSHVEKPDSHHCPRCKIVLVTSSADLSLADLSVDNSSAIGLAASRIAGGGGSIVLATNHHQHHGRRLMGMSNGLVDFLPRPFLTDPVIVRMQAQHKQLCLHSDGTLTFFSRCDQCVYKLLFCRSCSPKVSVVGLEVIAVGSTDATVGQCILFTSTHAIERFLEGELSDATNYAWRLSAIDTADSTTQTTAPSVVADKATNTHPIPSQPTIHRPLFAPSAAAFTTGTSTPVIPSPTTKCNPAASPALSRRCVPFPLFGATAPSTPQPQRDTLVVSTPTIRRSTRTPVPITPAATPTSSRLPSNAGALLLAQASKQGWKHSTPHRFTATSPSGALRGLYNEDDE